MAEGRRCCPRTRPCWQSCNRLPRPALPHTHAGINRVNVRVRVYSPDKERLMSVLSHPALGIQVKYWLGVGRQSALPPKHMTRTRFTVEVM